MPLLQAQTPVSPRALRPQSRKQGKALSGLAARSHLTPVFMLTPTCFARSGDVILVAFAWARVGSRWVLGSVVFPGILIVHSAKKTPRMHAQLLE